MPRCSRSLEHAGPAADDATSLLSKRSGNTVTARTYNASTIHGTSEAQERQLLHEFKCALILSDMLQAR